jgi:hypothetical protein
MHWLSRVQISGAGLTIVTGIAPSLGITLPQFVRWSIFALGALMILWPLIQAVHNDARRRRRVLSLIGMNVSGLAFAGCAVWYFSGRVTGPIEWAFEQPGAYGLGLEWSVETPGEMPTRFLVEGLIFRGKNVSDRPIYKMSAYITVDDSNREIPLYMAAGQWRDLSDIESIPPGANFEIGCQTRPDGLHCVGFPSYLTPEQFMHEIGAFTLTCKYDGVEQKWRFSAEELQRHFDQEKRRAEDSVKSRAPRIVVKKQP